MTKDEIQSAILERLAPLFPGFRASKKAGSLSRKIDGGTQTVGVPLVDYRPQFKFSLVFSVRLEAVQALVNQFSGTLPKYAPTTITSATRLDYFFDAPGKKEFAVATAADVDAAVQELAPVIRDRILPFLDAHRTVAALSQAMNHGEPRFDELNDPYRSMSAITLAGLAKDPDFDALAARYAERLRAFQPHDRDKLTRLVDHLRGHLRTP